MRRIELVYLTVVAAGLSGCHAPPKRGADVRLSGPSGLEQVQIVAKGVE